MALAVSRFSGFFCRGGRFLGFLSYLVDTLFVCSGIPVLCLRWRLSSSS